MMSGDTDATRGAEPPEIFPLPARTFIQYAASGGLAFGWLTRPREDEVRFVLFKYRWTGGVSILESWPLSDDGWRTAWAHMATEHPGLAEVVAERSQRDAHIRLGLTQREDYAAELEGEGRVQDLRGCVFLGGYGMEEGLAPGDKVDIFFTRRGVWVAKEGRLRPYLRRSYDSAHALEFEGGALRKGGGYVGGGFGIAGAAEGMAVASLLNSLTTKTSIHTTIRFEAEDAEVFFFTDQALPKTLEMRLAEVRAKVRANRAAQQPEASDGSDFSARLLQLGAMLDKGQITAEEFAIAKERLFSKHD